VPRYDYACAEHGVHEVFRRMSDPEPKGCTAVAGCDRPVTQHFSPAHLPNARIEVTGEDSTDQRRVEDGTAVFNVGLPPVETVVGTRADGKPKLAHRPITHHEVGSKRNAHELAKRAGLIPMAEGSYRTLGKG
jgi:hypothetical protein